MLGRVSTFEVPPEHIEELTRFVEEHGIPFLRRQAGFRGAYWLADRQIGKVMWVAFFDSHQALRAATQAVRPATLDAIQQLRVIRVRVEHYEVIAHA